MLCLEFGLTLLLGRRQFCFSLFENRMAIFPTTRSPSPLILPHFSWQLLAGKTKSLISLHPPEREKKKKLTWHSCSVPYNWYSALHSNAPKVPWTSAPSSHSYSAERPQSSWDAYPHSTSYNGPPSPLRHRPGSILTRAMTAVRPWKGKRGWACYEDREVRWSLWTRSLGQSRTLAALRNRTSPGCLWKRANKKMRWSPRHSFALPSEFYPIAELLVVENQSGKISESSK